MSNKWCSGPSAHTTAAQGASLLCWLVRLSWECNDIWLHPGSPQALIKYQIKTKKPFLICKYNVVSPRRKACRHLDIFLFNCFSAKYTKSWEQWNWTFYIHLWVGPSPKTVRQVSTLERTLDQEPRLRSATKTLTGPFLFYLQNGRPQPQNLGLPQVIINQNKCAVNDYFKKIPMTVEEWIFLKERQRHT